MNNGFRSSLLSWNSRSNNVVLTFSICCNFNLKKKDHKKLSDWQIEDDTLLDDEEFMEILEKYLKALPEKWSIAVKVKYLTGKNGKEICEKLNITSSNFWQILHRAKLHLRDCIETNWFKFIE